ncbi:hypothetical protein BKA93DRAFT_729275, partial [Sparassis latifolia]
RVAIFTDNLNTVQIFDSFRGCSGFEDLLLHACGLLIANNTDLRVWHIISTDNVVADALSCQLFDVALQSVPSLQIHFFIPSCLSLGGSAA